MKTKRFRRTARLIAALAACLILCLGMSTNAWAYFNRGTVGISTGQKEVSVTAGSSTTVSVSLSPASDQQTEGCGMAECPQICGEKECLDANGQCTCNGTEYKTYTTSVAVSSSNTSVATASYSNGTLSIRGVSEGTAVLNLTASLRQFSSGSTSVTVHVSKGSSGSGGGGSSSTGGSSTGGSSGSSSSSGSTAGGSSSGNTGGGSGSGVQRPSGGSSAGGGGNAGSSTGGGVTANRVTGEDAQTPTGENGMPAETPDQAASQVTTMNSDRGMITFVPISAGETGADDLAAIQGKQEYVDFQQKDEAGNIVYAWEFLGTDIKNVFDMDFGIQTGTEPFDGCDIFDGQQALYLSFAHDGELPGKASVFLKVPAEMEDGSQWYLYYYDEKTGGAEKVAEALTVENGYVTLELTHCSDYVLCGEEIAAAEDTGSMLSIGGDGTATAQKTTGMTFGKVLLIVLIIIVIVILLVVFAGIRRKKGGSADGEGNGADRS